MQIMLFFRGVLFLVILFLKTSENFPIFTPITVMPDQPCSACPSLMTSTLGCEHSVAKDLPLQHQASGVGTGGDLFLPLGSKP